MAELNFGLLTPPGSQSIGNAFVSGMDQAAVARAQENQNALSQYTLSKARREDELTNQMLAGMQGADTIEKQADVLRRGGRYKEANELLTSGLERTYKLGQIEAQPGARAKTSAETQKLTDESRNKAIAEVAGFPDVDSANAAIDARLANKIIDQATADQMRQGLTPETFTQWKHNTLVRLSTPAEQLKQSAVTTKDTDRGGFIERQTYDAQGKAVGAPIMLPKTAAPSTDAAMLSASVRFNPETGTFQNVAPAGMSMRPPSAAGAVPQGFPVSGGVPPTAAPAAVGGNAMIPTAQPSVNAMRPGAAPTAAPAVVGRGPSPREIREARAKGFIFNPDGSMSRIPGGPADRTTVTRTPVQETKFIKDLATDFTTVTATAQGMQDVIDSITDVRNSPGLAGATGISGMIYSMPGSQAATAETNLTNLKGKVTSLGQTLANASGKIGPMAVQEWTIVRDMVAALDKAVSKGEKITLTEIEKIEFTAKNIVDRVKAKFEGQYGEELSDYPQFATISAPKSRFGGKITRPPAAATPAGNSVTAPNGQTYTFDTPEQAKAYRKAAGIK